MRRLQGRHGLRIPREAADAREAPVAIREPGQGIDEHRVPLARHDGGDAQQRDARPARAARERRRIGARLDHGDALRPHAVPGEPARGRAAGRDDRPDGRERLRFRASQRFRAGGLEPGLVCERVVHERNETEPVRFGGCDLRESAERESVDENGRAVGNTRKCGARGRVRRRRRRREARVERVDRHRPAEGAQARDDATVVLVAAGGRQRVAGQDQRERRHVTRRDRPRTRPMPRAIRGGSPSIGRGRARCRPGTRRGSPLASGRTRRGREIRSSCSGPRTRALRRGCGS